MGERLYSFLFTVQCSPAMNDPHSPALIEQAATLLRKSPYVGRRIVRLETSEGRVILRGTVGSYFQKQMAQEALRPLARHSQIDNQLEVEMAQA